MIRSIRPTDLLDLAYFNRRARTNVVKTRDSLGREESSSLAVIAFVKHWLSLEENRHTWVCLRDHRVRGLISARTLAGPSVWEVDRLQLAGGESDDLCLDLLHYLSLVGGEMGMEKVFLRLPNSSSLVDTAKLAGFSPYLVETLYRLGQKGREGSRESVALPEGFRPKASADDHDLFRFYNAVMPDCVRRVEAEALQEWQQIRNRGWEKRGKREYIGERDGTIIAWLGLCRLWSPGYVEIMVRSSYEEVLDPLLAYAKARFSDKQVVLILVPEFEGRLRRSLLEHGFEELEEYVTLAKHLTVRPSLPRFVPVRV